MLTVYNFLAVYNAYSVVETIVQAFDWGFSLIGNIFLMPFNTATDFIFGGSISFTSFIYNTTYLFNVPNFGLVSDAIRNLFELMYGWTQFVLPFDFFGVCIIIGTFGNVFFISIIHWILKLINDINVFS